MNILERIKLIIGLMDLEKNISEKCMPCANCKSSKELKDRIIGLSAELIAIQSKIINNKLHDDEDKDAFQAFEPSVPPPKNSLN